MRHLWLALVAFLALPLVSVAFFRAYQAGTDPAGRLFALGHVLDIQIELSEEDWDTLRRQHPDVNSIYSGDRGPRPYTYFEGFITINGTRVGPVGIRKKGFVGSDSTRRPSLKIDFQEYVEGLDFSGTRRLTLNNNQQDPSCMHQVLSYYLFRGAGVPAPRCNYATVTVNGEYKGLYSNVEPIKKPFLRRHFSDDGGNLYEGQRSDFRPGFTASFEKKTNKLEAEQQDLDALVSALEVSDDELIAAVGEIVDIEAFIRFWAAECLIGHYDGYSENLNNYYLYHDPESDKFHFIPWGADSAWGDPNDSLPYRPPDSVRAVGFLARRLYNHPETRQRYREILADLLKDVWSERKLLALVDRLDPLVVKNQAELNPAYGHWVSKIRAFIRHRHGVLEADLSRPATAWTFPLESTPLPEVREPRGTLQASFSTRWSKEQQDLRQALVGSMSEIQLQWDEDVPEFTITGASAQPFPEAFRYGYPQIVVGGMTKQGRLLGASLIVDPELFRADSDLPIDSHSVMGDLIEIDFTSRQPSLRFLGNLSGRLKLDRAGTRRGSQISGTLTAEIR